STLYLDPPMIELPEPNAQLSGIPHRAGWLANARTGAHRTARARAPAPRRRPSPRVICPLFFKNFSTAQHAAPRREPVPYPVGHVDGVEGFDGDGVLAARLVGGPLASARLLDEGGAGRELLLGDIVGSGGVGVGGGGFFFFLFVLFFCVCLILYFS
ncbi:hypothetical protein ACFV2G_21935, partial [Streptomyces sp. NPDC059701]